MRTGPPAQDRSLYWQSQYVNKLYLIVAYDWKGKERLPDMTSHIMLLDVGVSQKKKK
jgi:hypothetical protein